MKKKLYILTPKSKTFVRFTITSNLSSLLKGNEKYNKKPIDEEYKKYGGLDYENSFFVHTPEPNKLKNRLKTLFHRNRVEIRDNIPGKSDMFSSDILPDLLEVISTREFKSLHKLLNESNSEGINKLSIKNFDFDKYKPKIEKKENKMFSITEEQQQIVDYVKENKKCRVKINAFAGTGKTSTLEIISENLETQILYLAFNNSIATEGKKRFPKNVTVMTTHSMGLFAVKKCTNLNTDNIKHSEYKPKEIKEFFPKEDYTSLKSSLELFEVFCNSEETYETFFDDIEEDKELKMTKFIWDKMNNGEISMTHNFYLKKFDLLLQSGELEVTKYDTILLDEAQDTNEVTLSIFKNIQGNRKIIVGDKHQQIYSFRGSVNLMNHFEGKEFYLTETFRYNKTIAKKASTLLNKYKWEDNSIVSKVEDREDFNNEAYLFRTNSQQIKCIAEFLKEGKYFKTIREPKMIFSQIIDLAHFKRGEKDKIKHHKYLTFFETFFEIIDYADSINDITLKTAIKIIQEEGYTLADLTNMLEKSTEYYKKEIPSEIYISTIHTSKGLEWDKVTIGSDLVDIISSMEKEGKEGGIPKETWCQGEDKIKYFISKEKANNIIEELNLFYVAITRAKNVLVIDNDNSKLLI